MKTGFATVAPADIIAAMNVVQSDLERVEEILASALKNDSPSVQRLIQHAAKYGGKRIRPALLFLSARASGTLEKQHDTLGGGRPRDLGEGGIEGRVGVEQHRRDLRNGLDGSERVRAVEAIRIRLVTALADLVHAPQPPDPLRGKPTADGLCAWRFGHDGDLPDVLRLQLQRGPGRDLVAGAADDEDLPVETAAEVLAARVAGREALGRAVNGPKVGRVAVQRVSAQGVGVGNRAPGDLPELLSDG